MKPLFRFAGPFLLCAGAAHAQHTPYGGFPQTFELFQRLLADPREMQLKASYYRLNGINSSDVALGHSWGMARWYSNQDLWAWQWDLEAMAYSRFKLSGAVNEFETVDFFANLPLELRHGTYSGKFKLFHESSHLGDDSIRRTGNSGFRYSIDGLRAVLSAEPAKIARVYGGGTYLLHSIPSPKRGALQMGLELTSPKTKVLRDYSLEGYLAQDLQWHENAEWNVNTHTALGLRVRFIKGSRRVIRVHIGYFDGHSPYGQFFNRRERYSDLGFSFDL